MRNSSVRVAPQHRNVVKINTYSDNPRKKPNAKCEKKARIDHDQSVIGHPNVMEDSSHTSPPALKELKSILQVTV
ncbi:MAG: hypothetical protein UY12_C0030G0009 [Parcubacteria group bacterium GW2011_GWA2_47_8b]|nr:MAG: hypothetical protein UY12_C0030G0009 [Parcubacteria group bacterium GW2011_GWA2_47_8b]